MDLFKEKNRVNENNVLSATRPIVSILKVSGETKTQLQTRLKQKSIIKIYINENRYYVEHSVAYALGLIKTRAIMMDNPKLIEITCDIHSKLKSNDNIEIEYIKVLKKQSLKVYVDGINYCINTSAAYALGFLTVEEFNNAESQYYYINIEILETLKNSFNVELYSLNLLKETSNKKL